MRQFVVLGHDAPVDPEFDLDDIAGGAGRLDLLCRCLSSALFLSHDVRRDVRVHLVHQDALTVTFDGADLRYASPDERNLAALVRGALDAKGDAIGHQPAEASPGVTVRTRGFAATLDALEGTVVTLHEDGDPVADLAAPDDPVFVLSDHHEFGAEERAVLDDAADARVRLGPRALHANHAITVAHNFLDTDGYTAY